MKARSAPDASSKALAHYAMGIIYDNEGRTAQAADEYKAALALEPKMSPESALVRFHLGADYDKMKERSLSES